MARQFFLALAVSSAALGLAGCGDSASAPEPAPSWSDPDAPAGISVSEGRMTLPAVAGNPGAVYFTIRNGGDSDEMLRAAWVSGAGTAQLHQSTREGTTARMREVSEVTVPAGGTVSFAPGGLHVMAFDISDRLEIGSETEVTLTFASGDKVSFPVQVRAAGDAG